LIWILARWFLPADVESEARSNAEKAGGGGACCHHEGDEEGEGKEEKPGGRWNALANAFVMDWMMLWKELLGGFLIAGFIATLVPHSWWQTLFWQSGPESLRLIENALVGPIIAILSFVCSVGNIPLASHLWANGISFGGVISFIYADLLVVPLILIYRKYYGTRPALYFTAIFYVAMVVAGIVVDLLFALFGLLPAERQASAVEHAMITWNYTSWLDLVAVVVFGVMLYLYLAGKPAEHSAHHH